MWGRKQLMTLLAVGTSAIVVPGRLWGQTGRVWLEPKAGWLVPTRDLGRTDILGGSGYGIFDQVDQSAVVGLGIGFDLGARWALRATVDRSFAAEVKGEWRCVAFVACPSVLLPVDGQLTRWTTSADLLYRPPTPLPVAPVVFAGVGVRSSQLDWSEPAADVTLPAFSFDETEAVVRLGLGLERSLGRTARLFGEVEASSMQFGGGAYESIEGNVEAERTTALDFGFVGGIRIRLR